MENSDRSLARVEIIRQLRPIENADAIECALVGGWEVVVKKGEFKQYDKILYLEIDSWVPEQLAPFLYKGREYEGVAGERLKTVKLRGQVSQGLVLPLPEKYSDLNVGVDLTDALGIIKWERPIPASMAGSIEGAFPVNIVPRTKQERYQNVADQLVGKYGIGNYCDFEVSEKLDGTSVTIFKTDGVWRVCSRNWELKEDDNNLYWRVAKEFINNLDEGFRQEHFAFQGEIVGPGVQGNKYKLERLNFYIFDIYNQEKGEYLNPISRMRYIDAYGMQSVPIIGPYAQLKDYKEEGLIKAADGQSLLNQKVIREGLVFKSNTTPPISFKVISNKFLLKYDE